MVKNCQKIRSVKILLDKNLFGKNILPELGFDDIAETKKKWRI